MALPRFARNTLHSTLAGASTALGGFLSVVVVARLLGPDGAGAVALGIWLVGVLVTLGDLGLPLTVARFIPDLSARKLDGDVKEFAPAFFPWLLGTTCVGALSFVFIWAFCAPLQTLLPILPFDEQNPVVWLSLAFLFIAQALGNYGLAQLRGMQRFDQAARLSSASLLIQMAGVVGGALAFGAPGAIAGYSGGSILLALYAAREIRAGGRIDSELRARAWRFSLASWGVGLIAAIVWSRTELAFLNHFRSAHEAGLYSVANTLAQIATQAPLLMTGGLLALFAERHAVGDHDGVRKAFESAVRFMSFLVFPACFGMAAIAPSLVPALFGAAFAEAADSAALLVAAQAFGAISTVSSALLFATERNSFLVRAGLVSAAAVIAAGLFVIPVYGLMGAVVARSTIQFANVVACFVYIDRSLGYRAPYASVARVMAAATGCGLAARAIVVYLPGPFGVALAIGAGALVYLALARVLRVLPADDVGRLQHVADKLPPWLSPLVSPLVQFFER